MDNVDPAMDATKRKRLDYDGDEFNGTQSQMSPYDRSIDSLDPANEPDSEFFGSYSESK